MKTKTSLLQLLGAAALVVTACGGTSSATPASPTSTPPSVATPQVATTAVTETTEPPAPATTVAGFVMAEPEAPEVILAKAIEALGDSYLFTSEVVVNGDSITLAEGRNVGTATEFQLTQQGTTLTYRSIGMQRWVQAAPTDPWVALADSIASTTPLTGLDSPFVLGSISNDGVTVELLATYDTSVLSLTTPGQLIVTLTVIDGVLSNLDYTDGVANSPTELHTNFAPDTNLEPIVAP